MKKLIYVLFSLFLLGPEFTYTKQPRQQTYLGRDRAKKRNQTKAVEAILKQQQEKKEQQQEKKATKAIVTKPKIKTSPVAPKAIPTKTQPTESIITPAQMEQPIPSPITPAQMEQPAPSPSKEVIEEQIEIVKPTVIPPKTLLAPLNDNPYQDPNGFYWIIDQANQVWWSSNGKYWLPWIEN